MDLLREQGVMDQIYANTLGNVVSVIETLARAIFATEVIDAEDLI